jgi:hypothetical protein
LNQHGGFDGPHGIQVERRRTQESETVGEENGEAAQRCRAHRRPRQEGRRRQAARPSGGETEDRSPQGEAGAQEDRAESGAEKKGDRGAERPGTSRDGTEARAQHERTSSSAETGGPGAETRGPAAASGRRRAKPAAEAARPVA